MKLFKTFLSLFFILSFVLGCKKYPDGPLISFRSKEHRIVGEWGVSYFSINGYDSTSYLQSQPLYGTYQFGKYESDNDGNFTYNSTGNQGNDTSRYYSAVGDWKFVDNKKSINITCHSEHPGRHFQLGAFVADNATWRIMRLTETELWLKTTYTDGREYFIKFKA